ncbi:MAG: FHA domain-containing protein [Bifidobacteriaceae bacterium]|nr:FHA domain-containing protein [Bifidobacteriaceae bacterium]
MRAPGGAWSPAKARSSPPAGWARTRGPAASTIPASAAQAGRQADAPRPGAPTKLVVKTGPLRGTTLPLGRSPVVIGRSSTANLVVDDDFASGRHAQIVPRHGAWVLEDLGSTHGTFVGRERITGPRELAAGQSIRIGNTTLEVLR